MKRIAILTVIALSATAVAYAGPVTVETPKTPISLETADAYVAKLEQAVKEVCYKASTPVIGVGFYGYLACVKETRADVAKQDPTGLYAKRDSVAGDVFGAK